MTENEVCQVHSSLAHQREPEPPDSAIEAVVPDFCVYFVLPAPVDHRQRLCRDTSCSASPSRRLSACIVGPLGLSSPSYRLRGLAAPVSAVLCKPSNRTIRICSSKSLTQSGR